LKIPQYLKPVMYFAAVEIITYHLLKSSSQQFIYFDF
jgi:hypothetical protein